MLAKQRIIGNISQLCLGVKVEELDGVHLGQMKQIIFFVTISFCAKNVNRVNSSESLKVFLLMRSHIKALRAVKNLIKKRLVW